MYISYRKGKQSLLAPLTAALCLFFGGCFRPAPPVEEGDGLEPAASYETRPDGTIVASGHPLARKRILESGKFQTGTNSPPNTSGGTQESPPSQTVNPTPTSIASLWKQEAYIKAANAEQYDYFGSAVSLSGDTLAVAALNEDSNQTTITNGSTISVQSDHESCWQANIGFCDSGAIYVYRRSGANWAQEAYIKAANAEQSDYFGQSISLSGDTLAVAAFLEDSNQTTITNGSSISVQSDYNINCWSVNIGLCNSGAVYVYRRSGANWAQEAYIKAANAEQFDFFGYSISLSGDTLAVAAPYEDSNQNTITNGSTISVFSDYDNCSSGSCDSGAVYVYRRTGPNWSQEAYIKSANAEQHDHFGYSVSLSGDTLAVAALYEDSNQTAITNGSTISLSSDYNNCSSSSCNSGAVYVYRRTGANWEQEAYIKAANAEQSDNFGHSISLSGDTLAVGAPYEDSNQKTITNGETISVQSDFQNCASKSCDSGAVYVYRRTGVNWAQEAYIKASHAQQSDFFGQSVSLSGDTLAVGVPTDDSGVNTISSEISDLNIINSGGVYVFQRSGVLWSQEGILKAPNAGRDDYFGQKTSISGNSIAVGVVNEMSKQTVVTNGSTASSDDSYYNVGAAYVFKNAGRLFAPDVRISATSAQTITLAWGANLRAGTTIKIAPATLGTVSPPSCSDAAAIALPANTTTYTYGGLSAGSKYGFRICATDGAKESSDILIWADTAP